MGKGAIQTVSKTTARTPRAARAEAQERPEAPPPMTATVGSSGTGVENTTCSWWKLFLMADCRENPGLPRRGRRGGGLEEGLVPPPRPPEAATTPARRAAGSRRGAGGGIAEPRGVCARRIAGNRSLERDRYLSYGLDNFFSHTVLYFMKEK